MCCGANLTLQGSNSGNENTYDLDNATTRWQVVVFYSGDWEEDSLNAIMAFSSLAADFRQAGCCIYGCSTDGIASHHAWTRSELGRGPNIPLLSDVCGRLASRFGLFDPEESVTLPGVALLNARCIKLGLNYSKLKS
jgi:alkyl hydroperoxide reductase subunit AhpC